jgi:hypothetical protein
LFLWREAPEKFFYKGNPSEKKIVTNTPLIFFRFCQRGYIYCYSWREGSEIFRRLFVL